MFLPIITVVAVVSAMHTDLPQMTNGPLSPNGHVTKWACHPLPPLVNAEKTIENVKRIQHSNPKKNF